MDENEYMELAKSIPATWYTSEESVEITKNIFYDIMISTAMRSDMVISSGEDMQKLLKKLADERNVPVEEVLQTTKNISMTVGAVRLFKEKFPDIAAKFPNDALGNPAYPPKFLAKILEITEEIASDLIEGILKEYATYLKPIKEER